MAYIEIEKHTPRNPGDSGKMLLKKHCSLNDTISFLEMIDACVCCDNHKDLYQLVDQLKTLTHSVCAILTYSDFMAVLNGNTADIHSANFGFPEDFMRRYFAKKLFKDDIPVVAFSKTFELQNWRECNTIYNSGKQNRIDEELNAYGIRDGWVYGVRDFTRTKLTTISIGSEIIDATDRTKAIIRLITPHIAEAYKRVLKVENLKQYHLTNREVEVLNWLKEGKTSWEISRILKISQRCVNFHIDNAKSKLNSANRTQAVAVALGSGMITL